MECTTKTGQQFNFLMPIYWELSFCVACNEYPMVTIGRPCNPSMPAKEIKRWKSCFFYGLCWDCFISRITTVCPHPLAIGCPVCDRKAYHDVSLKCRSSVGN